MIPQFDTPPSPGIHYRPRPGAYALLLREGRVLLTHQNDPVPEFQLPGGGIDPGESPLAALHREVIEETGWAISAPRLIGRYRRYTFMPDYGFHAEKICSVWLARPVLRRQAPSEPGHSVHWMSLARALNALADPGSVAIVRRWLGERAGR